MTADLAPIIRDHALALADEIEEANKAIVKTGGYPYEVGRKLGFGLALYMLLGRISEKSAIIGADVEGCRAKSVTHSLHRKNISQYYIFISNT